MNSSIWSVDSKYNEILEIANSFQKSKVFFTAIELNLFTTLGEDRLTAKEIAHKLNTDPHNTERLLNALCSMNLLLKHQNLYENSPMAKQHLLKEGEDYIGELHHISDLWETWSHLTYSVKNGKPKTFKTINDKDADWIRNSLHSLKWKAKYEAPEVVKKMNLRNAKRVLDLGCGPCSYLIEICENYPLIECVGIDYPNVVTEIEKVSKIKDFGDRIKLIPADVYIDDIGGGYDVVLISYLLNEYSIWDNIELLKKVYTSLNKNGIVYIHQQVINDDKISPKSAVMNSLNMMVNTLEGDILTETELWVILKEAWFDKIVITNTEFETKIISGQKLTSF